MTQSPQPPVDPSAVAEIAPGEGPEPGSVEYGGSEISAGAPDAGGADAGGPDAGGADAGAPDAVTTEAGTFEDLPVAPDEQGD